MSATKQKNFAQLSVRKPLVSVLFPVYNGAHYLEESIQSILNQTYYNFEIIIIDDGSTDDSSTIIQKFSDPRIRFYYNQTNQGLAETLNRAINLSKGDYLARQDQDDISLPKRFERQVEFFETHTGYGMVGTWAKVRRCEQGNVGLIDPPTESLILKFELMFNNQFVHSSVMILKEVFKKIGLYSTNKSRQPPEDYELWYRITRQYEVSNIPEVLLVYNETPNSMTRKARDYDLFNSQEITIMSENLAFAVGKIKPDKDTTDFAILANRNYQMLSSRPRFRKIFFLLNEAARMLSKSKNNQYDILRPKVRAHIQSISNDYCNHLISRYGSVIGRVMGLFFGVWKLNFKSITLSLCKISELNR